MGEHMDDPLIGKTVGTYTITACLSRSEVSNVYEAENQRIMSRVVIRVLPPSMMGDFDLTSRFIDAARAINRVEHPGVVLVEDAGSEDDVGLYLVQELVRGESLRQRLEERGKLQVEEAARLLRGTAGVLQAAHGHGVIHRNLRPANIMIVPDREVEGGERVRVLGFSVAKLMETGDMANTATGVSFGDFRYISPEQCLDSKTVTEASDVYALGVMGYRMLSGQLPHEAASLTQMVLKHHQEKPPPLREHNPDVPESLAAAVHGALELDPTHRIPTMSAFIEEILRSM